MPLTPKSQEIVDYVLTLTPEQFAEFAKKLTPEQAEYLDVILEKTQKEKYRNED